MSTERSPLLGATASGSGSGSASGSGSGSGSTLRPQPYFIDVPANRAFSSSTKRPSLVSGSVGRQGFADAFLRSQSPSTNHSFLTDDNNVMDEDEVVLSASEATSLAREQQALLLDNNIQYTVNKSRKGSVTGPIFPVTNEAIDEAGEEVRDTNKAWDEAVNNGLVNTTVRREISVLAVNAAPLIVTFSLQYSLVVASIFSVGHLGKTELGAVSLASMTASITGFAMIQGLATCLDTLCSQAYGAGNLFLVGVYFQKCVLMIMVLFIPVALLWCTADTLIAAIVPEKDLAVLAVQYLRIIVFGVPGYILFECGKRFVQAQGIFHASTIVLLICAPINVVLNYVLVWNETIGMGFKGAAVAVATTDWLMATLLFCYVYFIDGKKCWNGFSMEAFANWGPMLKLAIPGVIMVEAEFLAFEVLTLASSYFGTTSLAAQSVLSTLTSLSYQIPFAVSIACSTRVANFIGATLGPSAKIAGNVAIGASYLIAIFNGIVLYTFRYEVGGLFSSDEEVIELVAKVFPICAFMQLFDAAGAVAGGVLRGQGMQHLGGYLNLFFYYVIALPLAFYLAFTLDWELYGLWTGVTVGLICISIGETYFIGIADWDKIVDDARERTREERIMA
ncbi:Erc1p [Sugiyamaella lignohabitans]|uniref:Erc1p n=1 Tax=Sugiyamaella lignohabitans TaxID=796027 RepID=A0A167D1V8_9ASCO|nr:Erc1p [Sugiyamaella lignohabitans]ANB12375.1 Erc1p [Sugiyamaella lignohabitans]